MKRYILLLSLLLVRECVLAQVSLQRRSVSNKAHIGRGELFRQPGGEMIYVTATGGNFYSGRLLPNGEIDDTYNGERTSKELSKLINCKTLTARVDKWGRLLIAGYSSVDSNSGKVATMVRLTRNGDQDADYLSGIVQMKVGDSSEFSGVHVQPGERIMGIGTSYSEGVGRIFLARFLYNGEVDTTFASSGTSTDNSLPGTNKVTATIMQPDGKYIVVGNNGKDGLNNIVVAKYSAEGQRDTTFGNMGFALTAVATHGYVLANNVLLQADGKIVVGGMCIGEKKGGQDIFMVRYNIDGSVDPSFGKGGMVQVDVTDDDRLDDMLLLPDGRILLSGSGSMKGERKYGRYTMLRFSADGVPDKTYGYGGERGLKPTTVGAGFTALGHNIAASPIDGKVYRLSELVAENETETVLTFTTYLQDSALGIMDIPTGKLQNFVYPVPVLKNVTFSFDLIEDLEISVKVLDMEGKELATVVNKGKYKEGENSVTVNFPQGSKQGKYLVVLSSDMGYKVTVEVTKITPSP